MSALNGITLNINFPGTNFHKYKLTPRMWYQNADTKINFIWRTSKGKYMGIHYNACAHILVSNIYLTSN